MSSLTREKVLARLQNVFIPGTRRDVVSAEMISGVVIRGADVGFLVTIDPAQQEMGETLRANCEQEIKEIAGVEKVTAVLTAETAPQAQTPAAPPAKNPWNPQKVAHVKHVLLVASGKGGVGKSTTSVCLAHALTAQGKRVGLLDADIYGPSIPQMLGMHEKPDVEDGKLLPLEAHGLACMSIGLLMENDGAAVMRGPMITKALHQMTHQVKWGTESNPLDVLIIDLPPGTGDVPLSLAQKTVIDGAVIVTTPQQIAVLDARKGIQMFRKVNIPVFGVIENMSYLEQGDARLHPFGQGGGERLAREMGTLFLGEIPLLATLGQSLDEGKKPALPKPFETIADRLLEQLQTKRQAG